MTNSDDDRAAAEDVLRECTNDNCQALYEYATCQRPLVDLGYEDVFYPLRHHHREGLALVVDPITYANYTVVWGSGDLFFEAGETDRTMANALEPGAVYADIKDVDGSFEVVVVDPAPAEVADG